VLYELLPFDYYEILELTVKMKNAKTKKESTKENITIIRKFFVNFINFIVIWNGCDKFYCEYRVVLLVSSTSKHNFSNYVWKLAYTRLLKKCVDCLCLFMFSFNVHA